MKKFIYLILTFSPLLAIAKVPVEVVEQKYISVLARSFKGGNLNAPRNTLYWSLCLGETNVLSKSDISTRIASLTSDSAALHAFYRRLNYYRAYKADPAMMDETYEEVCLPFETRPKKTKDSKIEVLSYDKPDVTEDDWLAYTKYITSFGDDVVLSALWQEHTGATTTPKPDTSTIKVKVEVSPEFPGGDAALIKFLSSQIEYPQMERDNDISGKVLLRFVVCADGHVSAGAIQRSVSLGLDREAIRVLKMLPRFKPGMQDGKPVPVYFNLPIVFRLQ